MKTAKDVKTAILEESPFRLMLRLSVPAMVGMVVVGLYPLMDGIFAGNIIGQRAMTAIGIATPMTLINTGIATLVGVGSASVLSRAIGSGDQDKIERLMGNLVFWVLALSLMVTVLGIAFCPYYFEWVDASPEIKALAIRYIRIIFIGSFFVNFAQSANMILRGQGLMRDAMLIMGAGAILNIILDPILMTRMGERGIEGAAIATVTAQIFQALATYLYFKRPSQLVQFQGIRLNGEISREVFSVGISAMLMQVLSILQQTLLYRQAFAYGDEASGIVMAVCMRMYSFSFIPLWGMAQGLQPAVGTNFGAKKYDRVKEIMRIFILSATILAAVFYLPSMLATKRLLLTFGVEESILLLGVPYFRVFYSLFISYGLMIMSMTYFQSIGDGKTAGLLTILRQVVLFVPIVLILPYYLGNWGVWLNQPLVDFVVMILCYTKLKASYRKDLV